MEQSLAGGGFLPNLRWRRYPQGPPPQWPRPPNGKLGPRVLLPQTEIWQEILEVAEARGLSRPLSQQSRVSSLRSLFSTGRPDGGSGNRPLRRLSESLRPSRLVSRKRARIPGSVLSVPILETEMTLLSFGICLWDPRGPISSEPCSRSHSVRVAQKEHNCILLF